MSNATLTIVIIIVIIAVAAIAVAGFQLARRKQTERLRAQYGPEYDRALEHSDNQREAESELRNREKRHKDLDLRTLKASERQEFERRWTEVQGQFVDDPSDAVRGADRLVVDVMSARGYPVDDFDQRADDLSVSHPEVTQRYREARKISKANDNGSADTEDLRHAVTSYRSLVQALLSEGDNDRQDDRKRAADHDRKRAGDHDRHGDHDRKPEPAQTDRGDQTNGHVRDDHGNARTTDRETERETS